MWTQGRDNCDILDYWSWRHTSNASNISTRRNSVLTTGALVLNYENLPVSQFTLRLLQRHKWVVTSLLELFVKLSPKKQKTNRKTLIVKYTIKNFTCDLCVCEHISESRYFTSTPHAFKNIKTHIWPPTTTGAIKAARVGISHHLLRNVILAKTSSSTWPCHLQKYFTVSPSIFWGRYQ